MISVEMCYIIDTGVKNYLDLQQKQKYLGMVYKQVRKFDTNESQHH